MRLPLALTLIAIAIAHPVAWGLVIPGVILIERHYLED
jgi:hypothetical protein